MNKLIAMKLLLISLLTLNFSLQTPAQSDDLKIPAEVKPFVESGTKAIAVESGDLNGDKLKDYVLVLEKAKPAMDENDSPVKQRPLLLLIRGKNNKLSVVKRNEDMIMCSECGGTMGDPFNGVTIADKSFTVSHYGGSGIRWSESYKFNYSNINKTWQLVEIRRESFDAFEPDNITTNVSTPPKNFGKVDVADFDPDKFRDKGKDEATGELDIMAKNYIPAEAEIVHTVVQGMFAPAGINSKAGNVVVMYREKDSSITSPYKTIVLRPNGSDWDAFNLPLPDVTWSIMEPISVFFENVDKDAEKELIILEESESGAGPTGAVPFYRARIYDWTGNEYKHLDKLSDKISYKADTAAKVRKELKKIKK